MGLTETAGSPKYQTRVYGPGFLFFPESLRPRLYLGGHIEKISAPKSAGVRGFRPSPLLFGFLLLALLMAGTGQAATVQLEWDPSTDADLAGYRVYYQADSDVLPFQGTGAFEGNAPVEGGISTTATVSGLDPDRSHYFAVTAYNSTGQESQYSNVVEIKESIAPSISITSPANGSSMNGLVPVSVAAADNVGVAKVEFFINGALAAEMTGAPYVFSWDTSPLAAGTYSVSAKAVDSAGNEALSNSVSLAVAGDTKAPSVSLLQPANGSSIRGTVSVSASASDDVGIARLELFVDGTLLLTGNQSMVSYSLDTTALTNGNHLLSAKAYDAAGNVGASSATLLIDNAAAPALMTLADAQMALLIAAGKAVPTAGELARLDIAPYVNGQSQPNGWVDTGDVVVILSKLIGRL